MSGWPENLCVPTGCGKTSVLDIAVFELALQAGCSPQESTAARRVALVVDRRLVVDDAAEHARKLQKAVRHAAASGLPVLGEVSKRLSALAADPGEPLRVVRLRGGVYRDERWACDPITPTIILSTVDQVGSRLLFRGYGVSRGNRPVQAGLLAFDTRILLDEAHLSSVFANTLSRVADYQAQVAESPLASTRLVQVTRMSATLRPEGPAQGFELSPAERKDTMLAPRLEAPKLAALDTLKVQERITQSMRPQHRRAVDRANQAALAERLAGRGIGLVDPADANSPRVVGIVVNRVATARRVFDRLAGHRALLLTGRIRPWDRDRLLDEWLPLIRADRGVDPQEPIFVVATQTVEVGANLSFDALVTEAAPLDALRQRFGRLDRLGKRFQRGLPAPAHIVIRSDATGGHANDAVYGATISKTWGWLNQQPPSVTRGRGKTRIVFVDFGVNALDEHLPQNPADMLPMLAPTRAAPSLFPVHLDAWVRTDPEPDPDPDVAPFLHGAAETPTDVQVIWRADLDQEKRELWAGTVTLLPPSVMEALPVPANEARAWLRNAAEAQVADVEGGRDEPVQSGRGQRLALRWRGRSDAEPISAEDIQPGDVLVVPAGYGGADQFGWNPAVKPSRPVQDIATQCLVARIATYPNSVTRRPLLRVRLHAALFPETQAALSLRGLLQMSILEMERDASGAWSAVERVLRAFHQATEDLHLQAGISALLAYGSKCRVQAYPGDAGLLVSAPAPVVLSVPSAPEDEAEDEESNSGNRLPAGRPVPLSEHRADVLQYTERFAAKCGLAPDLARELCTAALWHDEGKMDVRFQAWLHGSKLQAWASSMPLAKSGRARENWGNASAYDYPRGMRHEFVSVRLLEVARPEMATELARFLVGTHHGHGRPFAPVMRDTMPVTVQTALDCHTVSVSSDHGLDRVDSGWPDLFWSVVRRHGWWGAAYLAAVLITADGTASDRERQKGASAVAAARTVGPKG